MAINNVGTQKPARLNTDFWKYWTGQTISNLGSSITLFALPLLVFKLTGSALNLGITTAAEFVPYLLFGLLIGAWLDRADRKRTMIVTDIARAVIIATIPVLAFFGILTIWWLYLVAFVHSTLKIAFDAGQFAALPSLVDNDDLVTANGRIEASFAAAQIAGPPLAGLLITLLPIAWLMSFDALSFLVSAYSLFLIHKSFNASGGEKKPVSSIGRDVIEGLRYVLRHPVLRNISLMMAIINLLATPLQSQLVLFAKDRLRASDFQVSLLFAVGSLGIVVLSLAAGPLRKRWSFGVVALGALMADGLLTVALAFTSWFWLALVLWGVAMGVGILFNINTGSLRQSIVPNEMLGRVASIARVLAWSAIPIGSLLGGIAVDRTGNVSLIYAVLGGLIFLTALAFSFSPLGHAERYLQKPEQA